MHGLYVVAIPAITEPRNLTEEIDELKEFLKDFTIRFGTKVFQEHLDSLILTRTRLVVPSPAISAPPQKTSGIKAPNIAEPKRTPNSPNPTDLLDLKKLLPSLEASTRAGPCKRAFVAGQSDDDPFIGGAHDTKRPRNDLESIL